MVPDLPLKTLKTIDETADPVVGTSELAEMLGEPFTKTQERLEAMEKSGLAASKTFGNDYGWWITESGRVYLHAISA